MATFAMHMTVMQLFRGSFTYRHHFDVEYQRLAGHRMVGIHGSHRVANLQYGYLLMALRRLDNSLHARLPFLGTFQLAERHAQFAVGLELTESHVGRQRCSEFVTGIPAFERLLKTWQQGIVAVQIGHWIASAGVFQLGALFVFEYVMKLGHHVVGNGHVEIRHD